MRHLALSLLLLSGCASARDNLLPTVGGVLVKAHTAQAEVVDARAASAAVVNLFCANPDPAVAPVCAKAEILLARSKDALNISADALEAASLVYTAANDAAKETAK